MPEVIRALPRQMINVVSAGSGVAVMKEEYGRSLQILLAVCGMVLLIAGERSQPAICPRRRASNANRGEVCCRG